MLRDTAQRFLNDERGGYTIWSLLWFMLYVAIGGLTVDATDAFNKQTMLQSTADAAALAGAMSLGVVGEDPVTEAAIPYARANMSRDIHGNVLVEPDVRIGIWDSATETFTEVPGYDPASPVDTVNAVQAITRRSNDNANPLAMNFLRILALVGVTPEWNIGTMAVAIRYKPECFLNTNSLVAGNKVDVTSNNDFYDVCIHGQNMLLDTGEDLGFDIQNNGTVGDDVEISVPGEDDADSKPYVCSNDGYCDQGKILYDDQIPLEALAVGDTIAQTLDPDSPYLVDDVYGTNAFGEPVSPDYVEIDLSSDCGGTLCVPVSSGSYELVAPLDPDTVYEIKCASPEDQLVLPSPDVQPILQDVAVISECRLQGQSNMDLRGVTLASSAVLGSGPSKPFDKATIHFPSGTSFGASDCDPTGNVWIYSASSVHISAAASFYGTKIIARGDVEMTANEEVAQLTVWAGEDIRLTANADFGISCPSAENENVAWRYRLVR